MEVCITSPCAFCPEGDNAQKETGRKALSHFPADFFYIYPFYAVFTMDFVLHFPLKYRMTHTTPVSAQVSPVVSQIPQ